MPASESSTWIRLRRGLGWLTTRKLELAIVLVGFALRASMSVSFRVEWSYDSDLHWEVVQWIAKHHRVPPVEAVFQAQHPPLYYSLAAFLYSNGITRESMVWLSIGIGTLRLLLIWTALEWHLPGKRWARVTTLALAAVLAAAVHLDGMVYPEALSCTWMAAALLFIPRGFDASPRVRYRFALAAGVTLGLGMLTKVSAVVVIGALGFGVLLELLLSGLPWRQKLARALPWTAALAVIVTICGWYYLRNVRDYGTPFVTTFDIKTQHFVVQAYDDIPLLDRRSFGYFVGWNRAIYDWPFWPAAHGRHPRFFPVAMASTFVDYWNFSFSGLDANGQGPMFAGSRPMSVRVLAAARYAMWGGTVIMLASFCAWVGALRSSLRGKSFGAVSVLLVPLFTVLAAAQFGLKYPVDSYGVVKGIYMQFGAAPMYLLYGLAVDWSRKRVARWPILALLLGALWCVATYTVYCRLRVALLPLG